MNKWRNKFTFISKKKKKLSKILKISLLPLFFSIIFTVILFLESSGGLLHTCYSWIIWNLTRLLCCACRKKRMCVRSCMIFLWFIRSMTKKGVWFPIPRSVLPAVSGRSRSRRRYFFFFLYLEREKEWVIRNFLSY